LTHIPVGAAEGCDLLILTFQNKIKRSQPSAAPTGVLFYPELYRSEINQHLTIQLDDKHYHSLEMDQVLP
jgi:hypothetical protein